MVVDNLTYYDDGWEELQEEEARKLELEANGEPRGNMVQVHVLKNGDIIESYDRYFEFEDGYMYMVEKRYGKWVRNGLCYNREEYNDYVNERRNSEAN